MAMELRGKIVDYDGNAFTAVIPYGNITDYSRKGYVECTVWLEDGRTISPAQRRKIFAMVHDIGDYVSRVKDRREYTEMLRQLQLLYIIDATDSEAIRRQLTYRFCELCDIDMFSLSDVDMTTAREFIDYMVGLCVEYDIPCNDTLLNRCEDVEKYLYLCVAKRKCAICGKKADIHEVEKVGMGNNRYKIHHLGQRVQPLCRLHHREEEAIGQKAFDDKYHMSDIRLDSYLCKVIGWRE